MKEKQSVTSLRWDFQKRTATDWKTQIISFPQFTENTCVSQRHQATYLERQSHTELQVHLPCSSFMAASNMVTSTCLEKSCMEDHWHSWHSLRALQMLGCSKQKPTWPWGMALTHLGASSLLNDYCLLWNRLVYFITCLTQNIHHSLPNNSQWLKYAQNKDMRW